ncbi:hypothetical protein LBMAG49_09190 [Planctomycetota bacterium]|nr:hypothetical protein LBMAG49_09190 [Planctomycetota bacterium]
MLPRSTLASLFVTAAFAAALLAQDSSREQVRDPAGPVPTKLLDTCDWRLIGPFRGGRVAAVTGVIGDRNVYYFGGTGGGVWQTKDSGATWKCVSDGFFGGSIGAVAVAPSDANIVWAGGGESTWRGNVSSGDGIWKSSDAGTTWEFCGLPDSRHISVIRIHPKDPLRVYVAVMGHVSGANEERGVYRTTDGGKTFLRVLFANAQAGAFDLCLDPVDPETIYASTWRAIRTPHSFASGGEGSTLWKSTDGGNTWKDLGKNKGMPTGTIGIIGVTVSPVDRNRVYAIVEAAEGGLLRSDDAGATWIRISEDRNLRQRAWYYSRCFADPKDKDTVYVANVQFWRSTDGGKKFVSIGTPHSDNHDLWIDPQDPKRMIEANDGGACVSVNGGESFSSIDNQPTAQFYRVATDTSAPYRVYGAQQDNSSVRIRSRSLEGSISRRDWESTAGGESGWIAPLPSDNDVVFGGNYGGHLARLDHRQHIFRSVDVWPDNPMGDGVKVMKYRFQWNFPILFSPHGKDVLYTASNVLFQSLDQGQNWTAISPDLTRNDPERQESSGGPITKDNTGVEYYCTIFTVAESKLAPGVIWCGSDDGLVHVTRDGGKGWSNVTPPELPEWSQINCIEADPFTPGGCWLAATRYKLDDFRPYLFVTADYGATWQRCDNGIDPHWFTRCIRADPVLKGMVYAGTERGVFVSYNEGRSWQRLQRNLPIVPITDLCVHGNELIAATQGRAFWSFDHLHHLRQLSPEMMQSEVVLFSPSPCVQIGGSDGEVLGDGRNPANVPVIRIRIGGDETAKVETAAKVEILDANGKVLWTRDSKAEKDEDKLTLVRGMNTLRWEPKFEPAKGFTGMILWSGGLGGPNKMPPGDYTVKLTYGEQVQQVALQLAKDPRSQSSVEQLQAKYDLVVLARDTITKAHETITEIRALREQLDLVVGRCDGEAKKELEAKAKEVKDALLAIEEALYQTKSKSSQDPLNYPIKLTDKLAGVMSAVNGAEFGPTAGQQGVADALIAAVGVQLASYGTAKKSGLAAFNALALKLQVDYVK